MNLLGIDYGLKKTGIAIAYGTFAEPFVVLRNKTEEEFIQEIKKICEDERVEKIIVGVSEGETAKKTLEFIEKLKKEVSLPIEEFDETLSTYEAQRLTMESGMKRSKRRNMEDAFAAAVMLQNYIDTNGN